MRVNGINMTKIATFALTLAMCALFMVPHNVHAQTLGSANVDYSKIGKCDDYHPSAQMCQFGSFVKSIAHSEERGAVTHRALHENLTDRYIGKANNAAAGGQTPDVFGRFAVFKEHSCDPNDHGTALKAVCAQGTDDPARPPVRT